MITYDEVGGEVEDSDDVLLEGRESRLEMSQEILLDELSGLSSVISCRRKSWCVDNW